jgi:hypothetical protein
MIMAPAASRVAIGEVAAPMLPQNAWHAFGKMKSEIARDYFAAQKHSEARV